jgi:hypothetical protein
MAYLDQPSTEFPKSVSLRGSKDYSLSLSKVCGGTATYECSAETWHVKAIMVFGLPVILESPSYPEILHGRILEEDLGG